jgi:hypothetical protein
LRGVAWGLRGRVGLLHSVQLLQCGQLCRELPLLPLLLLHVAHMWCH